MTEQAASTTQRDSRSRVASSSADSSRSSGADSPAAITLLLHA